MVTEDLTKGGAVVSGEDDAPSQQHGTTPTDVGIGTRTHRDRPDGRMGDRD